MKAPRVVYIWALLIMLALTSLPFLNQKLTTTLRIPQSQSLAAQEVLQREFGEDIEGTFTVIYHFRQATKAEIAQFPDVIKSAATVIPGAEIVMTRALGGYFFAMIQTPFNLPVAASYTEKLRSALDRNGMPDALVGGPPAIKSDVTPVLNHDLLRGEVIGALLAIFILISLLGFSRILLIPAIVALAVTSLSLGLVFLYSLVHPMVLYLPNIITLFSLGLALDYSLLVIYRYRSERKRGLTHEDACERVNHTALRTVSISATLVTACLSLLLLIDVPFIRSISLGALFVPLISLAVAHSLLPYLLNNFGDNSDFGWLSRQQQRLSHSVSSLALRRPRLVASLSILLLILMGLGTSAISLTPSSLTALPPSSESAKALQLVTSRLGDGVITPHIVIVKGDETKAQNFESHLSRRDDVIATALQTQNGYARIYVVTRYGLGSAEDQRFVEYLRNLDLSRFSLTPNDVFIAGAPAQGVDLLRAITSKALLIASLILVVLLASLWRIFGSIVLAVKALIMDGLSLIAALGALVLLVRYGIGTYKLDQVEAWSLLLALTILFGLSVDYEIFIVSRIKEAHDRGESNEAAVREGIGETSVVVTAAGLILIAALSGFVFGHFAGVQQLGLALLIGIALDITVVRLALLPATMVLLGRWNWYSPQFLSRYSRNKLKAN